MQDTTECSTQRHRVASGNQESNDSSIGYRRNDTLAFAHQALRIVLAVAASQLVAAGIFVIARIDS